MSIVILLSVGSSLITLYVLLLVVLAISVSLATDLITSLEPGVSVVNVLANCTVPISAIVILAPILIALAYCETFENITLVVLGTELETVTAL